MSRISRPQMFMDICDIVAKRSTCGRQNVGAVLVNTQHSIVSIGYNGPPSGEPHCTGRGCSLGSTGGCSRSIHAEENAINRYGLKAHVAEELDIYTSLSPCMDCARRIYSIGVVKRVFYRQEYRIRDSIEWLNQQDIKTYRLTPAGQLTDAITNELIDPAEVS